VIDSHLKFSLCLLPGQATWRKSSSDDYGWLIPLDASVSVKESSDCMYEHMSPNPCISALEPGGDELVIDTHLKFSLCLLRGQATWRKSSSDGDGRLILLNASVSVKESSDCMYENLSSNPCISAY
jgi:hypothetical protein